MAGQEKTTTATPESNKLLACQAFKFINVNRTADATLKRDILAHNLAYKKTCREQANNSKRGTKGWV